jgi:hypothetical protein
MGLKFYKSSAVWEERESGFFKIIEVGEEKRIETEKFFPTARLHKNII